MDDRRRHLGGYAVTTAPAVEPGTAGVEAAAGSTAGAVLRRAGWSLLTIVIAVMVLGVLWTALLKLFGVSSFVGKSPVDVWQYLFSDAPARGVRPTSLTAAAAREASFGALATTLNAAIGFVSGTVIATAVAIGFVLWKPFEPIAMLLRSVPLVAYGGVWTIVTLSVLVSIVLYEVMTIVETALLARWGPDEGVVR